MTAGVGNTRQHVELWLADLGACGPGLTLVEAATPRLSEEERAKIDRSVTRQAGIERRAAYIALRIIIERAFGTSWRGQAFSLAGTGKPFLDTSAGDFSLTHVDNYALIGINRSGPIGVDLEPVKLRHVADDRRHRIEDAAELLAGGPPLPIERERKFLQAWVRLEAISKCDGRGIGRLLTGLGIIGGHAITSPDAATYAASVAAMFAVHDLDLSTTGAADIVAAAALDRKATVPFVRRFPTHPNDLNALVQLAA